MSLQWNWNDGGRFACGFVGLTGDCVARSIAIATGENYRHVYDALGEAALKTPRRGVAVSVSGAYLKERGWEYHHALDVDGRDLPLANATLPTGVVIVQLSPEGRSRTGHLCTVINQVIHDTWDASEDESLGFVGYWTCDSVNQQLASGTHPSTVAAKGGDGDQVLTQQEFDRIMHRLRSLDNTAKNAGSTEGEKRNAIRMMQNLMLRHNLTRQDLAGADEGQQLSFTKQNCPVNGRRALGWEKSLAAYVTATIFPMTGWYFTSAGHRTLFCFYGPLKDVENCIQLFRELLVTIAAAAKLQYGGFSRGSGASYCEGYVRGLPRGDQPDGAGDGAAPSVATEATAETLSLIQTRSLALKKTLRNWLHTECGVQLVTSRRPGRSERDPAAEARGNQHGAQHRVEAPGGPKRIGYRA